MDNIKSSLTTSPFLSTISFLKSEPFQGTSYETLLEMGFSAKSKKESIWSKQDLYLLKKVCEDIHTGKIKTQVKNQAYYISHYVFHGTKSKSEIEGMINKQIRSLYDDFV